MVQGHGQRLPRPLQGERRVPGVCSEKMRRFCHNFPSADRFYLSVFCFFVVCKNDCDIIISVKSLVLIISMDDADCRAISQAALSQGCRTQIAGSASEASLHLEKERPLLSFCDASLADGGGMFRALG